MSQAETEGNNESDPPFVSEWRSLSTPVIPKGRVRIRGNNPFGSKKMTEVLMGFNEQESQDILLPRRTSRIPHMR